MFYLKKKTFGYQIYEGEPDDETLFALSISEKKFLENKLDNLQTSLDEAEEKNEKLSHKLNHERYYQEDLQKEKASLEEQFNNLKYDYDEVVKRTNYLSKIIRERSNAARNITPKKKHTGYVYVFTQPFLYRYEKEGRLYNESLLKTKFQTPYNIDIDYKYAYEQCLDDFTFDRTDRKDYANLLGLQTGFYLEKYEYIEKFIKQKISERCKGDFSKTKEITEEINKMNIICNPQLIRNGLSGYWEFLFFHKYHFDNIPETMSVKRKKKKTEASASDSGEDANKENVDNVEVDIIEEEAED